MRSRTDYCMLTTPRPRIFRGRYHRGHMQCIKAAKRTEAEDRYRPIAEAKAAAAAAIAAKAAPVQAEAAAPAKKSGNRKRKRRGPERKKASQR